MMRRCLVLCGGDMYSSGKFNLWPSNLEFFMLLELDVFWMTDSYDSGKKPEIPSEWDHGWTMASSFLIADGMQGKIAYHGGSVS